MIAGIDFSSRFVDVVLLDEDSDAATWHRFELSGSDAFERARMVQASMPGRSFWDDILAVGIEDPRGFGAGSLYRVQGAILAQIPVMKLVQPWIPSAWRKQVGLPGNASKDAVFCYVIEAMALGSGEATEFEVADRPQDFFDAYCIALATRMVLQHEVAA